MRRRYRNAVIIIAVAVPFVLGLSRLLIGLRTYQAQRSGQ